jgi:large subunit ribosomal protein L10
MRKSEKSVIVGGFSEKLKTAQAVIIAEYRGLKVSELTEIRKEIKKNSGSFKVIKNRLAKRAMAGSAWEPLQSHMKGPVGIASSEADPVTLSKIVTKYAESFPAFKLKAGIFAGKVLDVKGIEALSKLPSKEELYAKMLGTLQAPATNLVRVLQAVPQKLAMALKAISEKKQ